MPNYSEKTELTQKRHDAGEIGQERNGSDRMVIVCHDSVNMNLLNSEEGW